jgi:hypothetical protein
MTPSDTTPAVGSGPRPTFASIRKAITDSYYDCRNVGETMEATADLAATRVMNLLSQSAASHSATLTVEHRAIVERIRARFDFDPCHECDNASIAHNALDAEASDE